MKNKFYEQFLTVLVIIHVIKIIHYSADKDITNYILIFTSEILLTCYNVTFYTI
jgi:ABC-type sulfate transport system permease component